jgi:hypothetical protein
MGGRFRFFIGLSTSSENEATGSVTTPFHKLGRNASMISLKVGRTAWGANRFNVGSVNPTVQGRVPSLLVGRPR